MKSYLGEIVKMYLIKYSINKILHHLAWFQYIDQGLVYLNTIKIATYKKTHLKKIQQENLLFTEYISYKLGSLLQQYRNSTVIFILRGSIAERIARLRQRGVLHHILMEARKIVKICAILVQIKVQYNGCKLKKPKRKKFKRFHVPIYGYFWTKKNFAR